MWLPQTPLRRTWQIYNLWAGGSRLTFTGAAVRVQQVTIATGAVVSSNVVVAEMITEQIVVALLAALVHICRQRTGLIRGTFLIHTPPSTSRVLTLTKRIKIGLRLGAV